MNFLAFLAVLSLFALSIAADGQSSDSRLPENLQRSFKSVSNTNTTGLTRLRSQPYTSAIPASDSTVFKTTTTTTTTHRPCNNLTEWECKDGECIDGSNRCDNFPHCFDRSDEDGCSFCNSARFFKCTNGQCISKMFHCDGHSDCTDKSDEIGCNIGDFQCKTSKLRFPGSYKCDGHLDCGPGDHSDEEDCPNLEPCDSKQQFECSNKVCISIDYVCDEESDCPNGEDEKNCEASRCMHNPNHYMCKDGTCLEPSRVCDNRTDCRDGSDEGGLCSRGCVIEDCSHQCYSSPSGPHCMCPAGYNFSSEKDCSDIDECKQNISVCDHFCLNKRGSYSCECAEGYTLDKRDNSTCVMGYGSGFILFVMNKEIRQISLDGDRYEELFKEDKKIQCIAYDPVYNEVYWSDSKLVFSANRFFMYPKRTVLDLGIGKVESMDIDVHGKNLYLADSGLKQIIVCSLPLFSCSVLLKDLPNPRALRLDIHEKVMFWTDVRNLAVMKSGMDGSDKRVLVGRGLVKPNCLALDHPAKRVYWMDAVFQTVEHAKYDGTDRKQLQRGVVSHPYSMAVWESRLYWSDHNHEYLRSCLKRTGKDVRMISKGESKKAFFDLTLYHSSMKQGVSPCSSRPCSHLCLLSPQHSSGYVCACPSSMKLQENKHTCYDIPEASSIYLADGKDIYAFHSPETGKIHLGQVVGDLEVKKVGDFVYNPNEKSLIVSDPFNNMLLTAPLENGKVRHIINNVAAIGVSYDWIRDLVYFIDKNKKAVEVVTSFGLYRTILVEQYNPTTIAVAPLLGSMFFIHGSLFPSIIRCGLDGSKCRKILDLVPTPASISVDRQLDNPKIYWCNTDEGTIEMAGVEGQAKTTLHRRLHKPVSVLVMNNNVIWTLEGNHRMYISKNLTGSPKSYNLGLPSDSNGLRIMILTEVGWRFEQTNGTAPCQKANGGCRELCLGNEMQDEVCACRFGHELVDGKTCTPDCSEDLFTCSDKKDCIRRNWLCNDIIDCTNGEDEEQTRCGTKHRPCREDEFTCNSGNCISNSSKCDGAIDCGDGSDENYSVCGNVTCPENKFKCKTSNRCISELLVCDETNDCTDGSDEFNCSCRSDKFTCNSDSKCIPIAWRCDGDPECFDESDEQGCEAGSSTDDSEMVSTEQPSEGECEDYEFSCLTSDGVGCVLESSRCDGTRDCLHGDDEIDCSCEEGHFKCEHSDQCVLMKSKCDNEPDCDDRSDEEDCPNSVHSTDITTLPTTEAPTRNSTWNCGEHEFACNNGHCISKRSVCNGENDCDDFSDEMKDLCSKSCLKNNGGCQHDCHSSANGGIYCSCYRGFHLATNGDGDCVDDRECDSEQTCDHYCKERKGSYECWCMEGYSLEPDRRTCKLTVGKEWVWMVGSNGVIKMTDKLQALSKTPLMKGLSIQALDYDPLKEVFLYADGNGNIVQIAANGTVEGENLLRQRSHPQGISIDFASANFYFSEYFVNPPKLAEGNASHVKRDVAVEDDIYSVIQMCSLESGNCTQICRNSSVEIPSTKVSSEHQHLFYCMNHKNKENQGQIVISNLDGSGPRVLRQKKVVNCGALALDEPKRRVYWTNKDDNRICSVTWMGLDYRIAVKGKIHNPVGLMLMGHNLVWYNKKSQRLVSCHKYTSQCKWKVKNSVEEQLHPIALVAYRQRRELENLCAGTNCSQLCTVVGNQTKCMCQVGYKVSEADPLQCVKDDECPAKSCSIGTCETLSGGRFVCRCPNGYKGMRCEVRLDQIASSNAGTIVTVIFVLLLLIIAIVGFLWYKRHPFFVWKSKTRRPNQTYRFSNPAFGFMTDTPIVNSPAPSSCPSQGNNPQPCNITNPQKDSYGFENPMTKVDQCQINTSLDSAVASGTDSTSIIIAPHQIDLHSPVNPPEYSKDGKKAWDLSPFAPSSA